MYLELLEDKGKIKSSMVNRDYEPNDAESVMESEVGFVPSQNEPMGNIAEENESDPSEASSELSLSNISSDDDENAKSEPPEEGDDEEASLSEQSSIATSIVSQKNATKEKLRNLLQTPPKLSTLENKGVFTAPKVIPTMDNGVEQMSSDEEEDLKRELLFKFELLKKSYKNIDVPEYTIHSNFKKMNDTYENLLRHVSLDNSVENYKNILVGGFMLCEFILGTWLKFDMSGFTSQQILNMSQYETLLIELGEKSYVPEGKQWPVEVRLLGLITINAVIFIVSRIIMKKTGSNLMGMINGMKMPNVSADPTAPKKKMKGPDIKFDF
tara:strand:- start:357 stop:1334 length:978 start_codon:yes stop_codon:yes gene_type:complete